MQRRDFMKAGLAATAVTLIPTQVAAATDAKQVNFAGSVYFTADNPGRWAGKEAGHLPKVEIKDGKAMISTKHVMTAAHYIVKHTLFNDKMDVIGETVFSLTNQDKPESSYDLKGYTGTVYAVSLCNLHDAWVAEATA